MLIGAIKYECKKCKTEVIIEQRGTSKEKTDKYISAMFNKKLCSKCMKKEH